jgi:hypothetical protein
MASLDDIRKVLWNEDFDGSNDSAQFILEQYKLYVEMADRISERRGTANTFFLTFNTGLVSALAAFYEKLQTVPPEVAAALYAAAVVLSLTWLALLRSYRNLNSAKFMVIGVMEERLPSSPYWGAEWKALDEGKNWRTHIPFGKIEALVPVVFALIYIYLFFASGAPADCPG